MTRLHVARRVLIGFVAVVLVLAVIAVAVAISLVRRPFPSTDGDVAVPGLTGKVTVLRDARGVPQIYADTTQDLFRAQGFVAAQDRFFQMDLRRHVTSGRLAELVGPDGVESDKVIRTMGWRRVAEAELPTLAPRTRQILQAYADGVNAYLDQAGTPSHVSLEYTVLAQTVPGYRIEPWTPADSLAWLKAMAWDLRGDYSDELTRARLAGRVTDSQIADLYPPYPTDKRAPILSPQDWSISTSRAPQGSAVPSALLRDTPGRASRGASSPRTSPAAGPQRGEEASSASPSAGPSAGPSSVGLPTGPRAQRAYASAEKAMAAIPRLLGRGEGVGSNSWVVSGDRSTTGTPLLANDPHLGVGIPSIWHQAGLHCRQVGQQCPFDVSGFTFAGVPGVVIGHNDHVAWGLTNLNPDVTDFYLEQVRGSRYLRDGRYEPVRSRTETIKVAGGDDVQVTVRHTVHGPILSDVLDGVAEAGRSAPVNGKPNTGSYEVSLAWTALTPTKVADSLVELDLARDFKDFRKAAKDFAVPAQNLLYADTRGHIGYQAPGRVPLRRSSVAGAPPGYWPAKGWESKWDWNGYVPFRDMPYTLDPPEGYLVAANQQVTASPRPFLTTEWAYGFRSQRIRDLIRHRDKISPQQMSRIQLDTRNQFAPRLVHYLLGVSLDDPFTGEARDLLRDWDFTNPADDSAEAAAAAYYNAVWSNLLRLTFNDEMPADLQAEGGSASMETVSVLLDKPQSLWWDNRQTPGVVEGRDEILRQALTDARLELTRELGKDPSSWEWGKLHQLTLRHPVLGGDGVPAPVRAAFNRGSYEMPGGSAIVDANGWNAAEGYGVDWAPSMRMVVDLGDLDSSTWVDETGVSGHAYDDHYDDQVDAWVNGETFPWPFSEKAVRGAAEDTLTLAPQAG